MEHLTVMPDYGGFFGKLDLRTLHVDDFWQHLPLGQDAVSQAQRFVELVLGPATGAEADLNDDDIEAEAGRLLETLSRELGPEFVVEVVV